MRYRVCILAGLLLCARAARAEEAAPTVSVDLASLEVVTYRRLSGLALEKRLLVRLVQEGFAVVRPERQPDVSITLRDQGGGLEIEAQGAQARRATRLQFDDRPVTELHLEIAQKAMALARAVGPARAAGPPAPAQDAGATERRPFDATSMAGGRPAAAPPRWQASLGPGAVWREHAVDPLIKVRLRRSLLALVGLDLDLGWSPSRGADIRVQEAQLALGLDYHLGLGRECELGAGLALGLLLHRYDASSPGVTDPSGMRFDALVLLPVQLAYRFGSGWTVVLHLTPGSASRGRGHRTPEGTSWQRGWLRLESGIGLRAEWS